MNLTGQVVIAGLGVAFIVLVVILLARGKLAGSIALFWVTSLLGMVVLVSSRTLFESITTLVGAKFPVSALILMALTYILLVLILASVYLSQLSNRLERAIQEGAIENWEHRQGSRQQRNDEPLPSQRISKDPRE